MNPWLTALGVFVLAVLSFWMLHRLEVDLRGGPRARQHETDYTIDDMTRRTFGPAGELQSVLRSPKVLHFADDDTTELASPRMEIYNGDVEPWHVVAERGWVSAGNDVVLLHGDVEVWRHGPTGEREYQVLTSELRVLPKEQYAETDNAATIIGPATVTHAIGMRANFAHDRVQLLKQVKARHAVKPQS